MTKKRNVCDLKKVIEEFNVVPFQFGYLKVKQQK